jgi:hypothetical protein
MRTPKIEALHRLIDWLNARTTDGFKLYKLGLDNSWLGSKPWLSGFIDLLLLRKSKRQMVHIIVNLN